MRRVRLVQVPFMCGDAEHAASAGPPRSARALRELLEAGGVDVSEATVKAGAPTSLAVNRGLAAAVGEAVAERSVPIVLAGSCDASLGVLAGLGDDPVGVVWLDAHGDFNTPESSVSGFEPGMALAVVAGHCHRERWAELGAGQPVPEEAIALLGVRDLSPAAERERLEASAVHAVEWKEGRATGDPLVALDALARLVPAVYLHVDLDVFDPRVAPGVVDEPVPGGLSAADGETVVRAVTERFAVRAAALTTYVPDLDEDERTLALQLRIVELLVGVSGPQGRGTRSV